MTRPTRDANDRVLTTGQVARLFNVHSKSVTRWAKGGKLPTAFRTLGGHRRFSERVVRDLLRGKRPDGGEPR